MSARLVCTPPENHKAQMALIPCSSYPLLASRSFRPHTSSTAPVDWKIRLSMLHKYRALSIVKLLKLAIARVDLKCLPSFVVLFFSHPYTRFFSQYSIACSIANRTIANRNCSSGNCSSHPANNDSLCQTRHPSSPSDWYTRPATQVERLRASAARNRILAAVREFGHRNKKGSNDLRKWLFASGRMIFVRSPADATPERDEPAAPPADVAD